MRGLSLVAASGGHSSSRCAGLSLSRPLFLQSTGSRHAGSVIVAHGPSCSAACGIFPDQGSNPCPLHWQADSQPLSHQRSPRPSLNDTHTSFLPLLSNQGTNSAGSPETHGQDLSRQSAFCPEAIKDDIVGALFLFILCNEAPNLKSYILISINIRSCSLVSAVVHIR